MTPTVVVSNGVTIEVAPTGAATASQGNCGAGWFTCGANVGGGCCPGGFACGTASCSANATSAGATGTGFVAKQNGVERRMNLNSWVFIVFGVIAFALVI